MINITSIYQFGSGTLAVTPGQTKDDYYIYIKALRDNEVGIIGEKVADKCSDMIETYLTFPTEVQMLNVWAALMNKPLEELIEKWNNRSISLEWRVVSSDR